MRNAEGKENPVARKVKGKDGTIPAEKGKVIVINVKQYDTFFAGELASGWRNLIFSSILGVFNEVNPSCNSLVKYKQGSREKSISPKYVCTEASIPLRRAKRGVIGA